MRVVSIGDLVLDYYYKNNKLVGVSGGMTSHNIIANLAKYNISTAVFGVCGNDDMGYVCKKSLEDLKVNIDNVVTLDNVNTRCFHVSYNDEDNKKVFTSKKRCPFCNNKRWYDNSLIDTKNTLDNIKEDDLLVFDNLNDKNMIIIKNTNNIKFLDLGQYFEFENISNEKIIEKIKNRFTIINFNERVINYFKERFNLTSDIKLCNLFDTKLITITKGKKGVSFIYNNKEYNYALKNIGNEVDATGSGDAFFASIIRSYIKNKLEFNDNLFEKWYDDSSKITSKVVTKFGARAHLNSLYKIKKKNDCSCISFELVVRKKVKRCNININNLEKRVINALKSNAFDELNKINFNSDENYIFTGTGGSFSPSVFSSIVINKLYGSNTYFLLPREICFRNNKNIDKVFLFSYSGTTNDLIYGTEEFLNVNKYIITKGEKKNIVLKTKVPKNNIISYKTPSNKGRERGFLSFEGAIAPASIFLKYYLEKVNNNIDIEEFLKKSLFKWNTYFEKEFKKEEIKNMFKKGNIINIFTGDYTKSSSYDMESKFIESGIVNVLIHEKKNFSHGRFVNYENLNNKNSIYLKSSKTSTYEMELINYLKDGNNLLIESDYNDILCEYDLLIASQLLIYYVGKTLDIDVSKPSYSSNAMKLYFYKGNL